MKMQYIAEDSAFFNNINNDKFSDIETAFNHLKSNNTNIDALRKISDALSNLTGKSITVKTISPTAKNQECYVMSVYPDESTLDIVIDAVVNNQADQLISRIWKNNVKWIIEIDTRILTNDINLSDKELTALILHEVGHVMFSDKIPQRISRIVKLELAKTKMTTKSILQDGIFQKMLYFPILNICNMTKNKRELKNEVNADNYSIKAGYGKELNSAITKISGFAGELNSTTDDDTKELTDFSIDLVLNMEKRQNHIARKDLQHMIINIPSEYTRNAISKVSNLFNGDKKSLVMNESNKDKFLYSRVDKIIKEKVEEVYCEGFFNRVKKLKKIDPADLDYIQIEISNIKSNDDKMMIISYIYSKLDLVNWYLDILDSGTRRYYVPHSKNSLLQMKDQLEKYRILALNKKIPEIDYNINIQFPTGYEG